MKKFFHRDGTEIENPCLCSFGFFEVVLPTALAAVSSTIAAGATGLAGAAGIGLGATTAGIIGDIGTGALVGGALGAATDWKQPLKGAEYGALTGAGVAGGAILGPALGIGAMGGEALGGAVGGALGGAATGRNIGTSALMGAGSGLVSGAIGSLAQTPTAGGATSAAGAAAPSSVPTTGDLTSPLPTSTGGVPSAATSNVPGSVGVGAATGTPTATATPLSNVGSLASATSAPLTAPSDLSGLTTSIPQFNVADAAPTAAGGAAGGPQSIGSFLKSPQGMLAVGGLGLDAIMGNQKPAGFSQLQGEAQMLTQQGGQLQSYLQTGQLPPGVQHSLDTAANAARASVRSQYANAGMSGSSAEAQDIAAVGDREVAQGTQIAESLLQQGVQESQLGSAMYMDLMKIQMDQDTNLSNAIGSFVSAFAGMGKSPQISATGVT